jgi:hypothetical protein
MSPIAQFLKAAISLARQGVKQDDILRAAQQQFGEVSDLLKLQINKIFKTKNQPSVGIKTKDPVFDNTVETIPFDDTGTPFNPKDPQKVYGKPKEVDTGSPFEDYRRNVLGEGRKPKNRAMNVDELEVEELSTFDLGTDIDSAKLSVNDEIKKGVDEIMSDTSPAALKKSIEVDDLMLEYPGMSRELAKQIANDPDPKRKADILSMVKQTIKMGDEGMSGDEIIDIFKKGTDRTKQAKGGRIKMAKGGLPNILGF